MTTPEIIEAQQLARWIDGERDTLPNEECAVALWAMRPDLAPGPKVSVEDVLSKVTSDHSSKQRCFEDFEECRKMILSMRSLHNLAQPSAKMSLQDVLERVESGPFCNREPDHLKQKKSILSPSLEDRH